ncbi:MAG: type II toxin-antitoxin system prevent-host-death family antitoxin [Lautropia sp.]|nr:type II toxin-antitoxin system prevent-host-death family antitoxin [Lautropia sp.]
MAISTYSSRTFARDAATIKRAAAEGPVFITDRGKPALAVLSIEDYYRLAGGPPQESLLEAMMSLACDAGAADIELELPERSEYPDEGRIPDFDEGDS